MRIVRLLPFLLLLPTLWAQNPALTLNGTWSMASSSDIHDTGESISSSTYSARDWFTANVPTTVVAALVQSHVFSDPNYGMNLRETPGVTYPSGYNFSALQMPPGSPFRSSWWYRRNFKLLPDNKRHILHLEGINFRANVWLNGHKIANSTQVAGMWRLFEFDVTNLLNQDTDNAVAIEVFPPTPHDLSITYADWNPMPPDKNMGIWRSVYLTQSGAVTIRFPQVSSQVSASLDRAQLTVSAELQNVSSASVSGDLKGKIGDAALTQSYTLAPNEHKVVTFQPLDIAQPKLWWPLDMGDQNLQKLHLDVAANGEISDSSDTTFGIRQVTTELVAQDPSIPAGKDGIPKQNLLFKINGQKVLIRGGGYTFDMLLRSTPEKQEAELDYVRDMHLNTVRFEGKLEDEHFMDLADQKGILLMPGWTCCDHWERWKEWDAEDHAIAEASLRDQIRRLRSHPSVFVWLNGSDNPPPPTRRKSMSLC